MNEIIIAGSQMWPIALSKEQNTIFRRKICLQKKLNTVKGELEIVVKKTKGYV